MHITRAPDNIEVSDKNDNNNADDVNGIDISDLHTLLASWTEATTIRGRSIATNACTPTPLPAPRGEAG